MRIFLALLFCASAHAAGTCSGSSLAGQVGLAFRDSLTSVQESEVPFVFGAAECQCPNDDFALDILPTSGFPPGSVGTAELWAGLHCDDPNARVNVNTTLCEKIADVDFNQFVSGALSEHIYLPFSTAALFAPVTHVCPAAQTSNGLYLLFFTGANSSASGPPAAMCSLEVTEELAGPGAPVNVQVSGASLTWDPPDPTLPQPQYYQVLCADDAGDPVVASPPAPAYSSCFDGTIQRRPLATAAQSGLAALDPRYVCSDVIPIGTSSAIDLAGLKASQYVVVAIDQYGNATAAPLVTAPPPATAQGGCSAAPSSSAIGGGGAALVLLLLGSRVTVRTKQ
jgi:hypothetical protein